MMNCSLVIIWLSLIALYVCMYVCMYICILFSLIPRITIDIYMLALFICYSQSYNAFYSYIYMLTLFVCYFQSYSVYICIRMMRGPIVALLLMHPHIRRLTIDALHIIIIIFIIVFTIIVIMIIIILTTIVILTTFIIIIRWTLPIWDISRNDNSPIICFSSHWYSNDDNV